MGTQDTPTISDPFFLHWTRWSPAEPGETLSLVRSIWLLPPKCLQRKLFRVIWKWKHQPGWAVTLPILSHSSLIAVVKGSPRPVRFQERVVIWTCNNYRGQLHASNRCFKHSCWASPLPCRSFFCLKAQALPETAETFQIVVPWLSC